jgi:hypothetical protein
VTDTSLEIPRSATEILARIQEVKGDDFFGAQRQRLASALPWEDVQP